jgi:hypothetical protein
MMPVARKRAYIRRPATMPQPARSVHFMAMDAAAYPILVEIDPPRVQSRVTIFFRFLLVIPAAIVAAVIGMVAGVIALIAWFAILFTGNYPAGMANFSVGALRWQTRVNAYNYLLAGPYPPFSLDDDPAYPARVYVTPQLTGRNRLTVFFRYFMILPHAIVLALVGIAASFVLLIAWVAGTFTGEVPEGMHNFLAGMLRWATRVGGYYMLLTDEYPPFSMQ